MMSADNFPGPTWGSADSTEDIMSRTPDDRLAQPGEAPCAAADCPNLGRPQVCPYDGRYHHHGRIHYGDAPNRGVGQEGIAWRSEGWHLMCDAHYTQVEAWVEGRRAAQR
jgi:hypothetical protein